MARILGARIHGDRLKRLGGHVVKTKIVTAITIGAGLIAQEAKDSIIEGAVSGPGHLPSPPGSPPNADTHELDQSIHVVVDPAKLVARVRAESEHAAPQEFGTSVLPERPFLRPAGIKKRPEARRLVRAAVNAANRGK